MSDNITSSCNMEIRVHVHNP